MNNLIQQLKMKKLTQLIILQTKQEITLLIMKQVIQQTLQKMKQVTLLIQQTQMQRLITQKINN